MATPGALRTPTTESLVELENEKSAVYRTVGQQLYTCEERADIMHIVKETARKVFCPTESEEMSMQRITRYWNGVPGANRA